MFNRFASWDPKISEKVVTTVILLEQTFVEVFPKAHTELPPRRRYRRPRVGSTKGSYMILAVRWAREKNPSKDKKEGSLCRVGALPVLPFRWARGPTLPIGPKRLGACAGDLPLLIPPERQPKQLGPGPRGRSKAHLQYLPKSSYARRPSVNLGKRVDAGETPGRKVPGATSDPFEGPRRPGRRKDLFFCPGMSTCRDARLVPALSKT